MKTSFRALLGVLLSAAGLQGQIVNVTSTGLGINTTSPTERAQVYGNLIVGGGSGAVLSHYSTFSTQQNPFVEIKGDPAASFGLPMLLFSAGGRSTQRDFGGTISWGSSDYSTSDKRGGMISVLYSGTNYDAGDLLFFTRATGDSGPSERMRVSAAGNLTVGTATALANLGRVMVKADGSNATMVLEQPTTGLYSALFFRNPNGLVGSIDTGGSGTAYSTSSDARLKTNVRPFTDSGRLIDALRPVTFDWKTGEKDAIGFIAQEENAADPVFARIGAVTVGDNDPEKITRQWQRSDQALVPILVAEIKALRSRVVALEAQAAHQDDAVAKLAQQFAALRIQMAERQPSSSASHLASASTSSTP